MRIAIIGSSTITDVDISHFIPQETTQIITGGSPGVEQLAEKYADRHNIPKLVLKKNPFKHTPETALLRTRAIIDCAQLVIAIWDGESRILKYAIDYCKQLDKRVIVHTIEQVNAQC